MNKAVVEIGELYNEYTNLLKQMFGLSLRRKNLDYKQLQRSSQDIYSRVHKIKEAFTKKSSSIRQKDFLECFDLASGSLNSYIYYKSMYQKDQLATRTELSKAEKEHRHFNMLLIKASKNLNSRL
jgi:hypothetical protein